MPLLPPLMQVLIQEKARLKLVDGSKLSPVIAAISSATCQYLLASSIVNSTNNVLGPGVGTQVGTIVGLSSMDMVKKMKDFAWSQGLSGRDMVSTFNAVSFGVVNAMNAVVIQGTVIGGGPGIGFGKVTALVPTALTGMIMQQEAFRQMAGSRMMSLLSAISFGICIHIMSLGSVNITCIGAAAPPPVGPVPIPAAPGIGRFY